jgi:hypothetical protein
MSIAVTMNVSLHDGFRRNISNIEERFPSTAQRAKDLHCPKGLRASKALF